MIGSRAGTGSVSVPVPVWVDDRLQDRYEFLIGYRAGIGT